MSTSSWLIGSICALPNQTITVDANGAGPGLPAVIAFAYTGTYLHHTTAGLSMMAQLAAKLVAEGVTNADVFLTQSGFVRITADVSFVITWTDTALRDALGFTGTVTDTSAPFDQTAPNRSSYLWVPRRCESPRDHILGATGAKHHNRKRFQAMDGTQVTRTFGDPVYDARMGWTHIDRDQFWTEDEDPGELFDFYSMVISPGANIRHYRQVDADYAASTAVTLPTALGPYQSQTDEKALPMRRSASHANVDCKYDYDFDGIKVPEYTI